MSEDGDFNPLEETKRRYREADRKRKKLAYYNNPERILKREEKLKVKEEKELDKKRKIELKEQTEREANEANAANAARKKEKKRARVAKEKEKKSARAVMKNEKKTAREKREKEEQRARERDKAEKKEKNEREKKERKREKRKALYVRVAEYMQILREDRKAQDAPDDDDDSSWSGSGDAEHDEDPDTWAHIREALAPHDLEDVEVEDHKDIFMFWHDVKQAIVRAAAAKRKRTKARKARKYPGCGASADINVEAELDLIIEKGVGSPKNDDVPEFFSEDQEVLFVVVPQAAVLGSKKPSAKEWLNSLRAAGGFWKAHAKIFNPSEEVGYHQICDRLQDIDLAFCKELVTNGRRNAIEFLNEQGLLINLKVEKVVVITVGGTEEVLAVLVPQIFSPVELEQITLLTALLFKAKLVARRPSHCRGEHLYSPGLSTANCNPLKEGRHLRLFVTELELTILQRVTELLEVGWKRLERLVERLVESHNLVCDLSEQREIANRAWKDYSKICKYLEMDPVLPLETRSILKHYLSVNRFTSTHLDNRDRGYAFQIYFGSTSETGSFCLPSLALW
jgi:chemotaxis protein histidine kinase CheA